MTSLTGMSIGPSFSTARWIRTQPISHWRVKASTISSDQSFASISSNTDRNGCRLNVVMSIRVTTSIPDSLDAHGRLPNRVALHVRRSTSGLQDFSKLSGAATVSSDYVVKRIIVLVPPISAPRKA